MGMGAEGIDDTPRGSRALAPPRPIRLFHPTNRRIDVKKFPRAYPCLKGFPVTLLPGAVPPRLAGFAVMRHNRDIMFEDKPEPR